jgi:hypothetical protein
LFLVSKDLVSYIFLKSGVLFGYKDGAAYGHPCLQDLEPIPPIETAMG